MPGKCRPSLRGKTLDNVMRSNLSNTDKDCIKAIFERYVEVVRCKDCKHLVLTDEGEHNPDDCVCDYWMTDGLTDEDFCSCGERRTDG